MAKMMDKTAEAGLLDAVRSVSSLVETGTDPTRAITKVAGDAGMGADMVPLLVQAYNVGRTTFQQDHGGPGILDKQADFPIARVESVMSNLFPSHPRTPAQQKAAFDVSADYSRPPSLVSPSDRALMTKAAELDVRMPVADRPGPIPPSSEFLADKSLGRVQREKRSLDGAQSSYRMAKESYLRSMGALREYFNQPEFLRLPFDEVEYNATMLYGQPAKYALDYAYDQNGLREKRANGPPRNLCRVEPDKAPYSLVVAAIEKGAALIQAQQDLTVAEKTASENIEEALRPFEQAPDRYQKLSALGASLDQSSSSREKEAGFLGNMGSMGMGAALRGGPPKSPEDLVSKAELDLSDPDHLQELQEIETRAMLSDMMNNDEVISGHDPEEVLNAYNEIAQLSPRASRQPVVMRPLLRKHLTQGAVEPFEAQQIADIEKTVAQTGQLSDESVPANPGSPAKPEVLSGNPILQ